MRVQLRFQSPSMAGPVVVVMAVEEFERVKALEERSDPEMLKDSERAAVRK